MTTSDDQIERTLRETFGLEAFRPGQAQVIRALLAGRSAAAVFPTGAGKSLCYQLPALLLPGLTLVVSPLIALMKDQIDSLAARGISAIRLDSTLDAEAFRDAVSRIRSGEVRILYVAPERFTNERFREMLQGLSVSLFAVDEAHCISEWGHNFRPDYLKLARFAELFGAEVILALTATATPAVLEDIRKGFGVLAEDAVRTPFHRPNLALHARNVDPLARDAVLFELVERAPRGPTIVYTTLQRTAEAVERKLRQRGLPARAYHAGMKDDVRAEVQDWFMQSDDGIVAATIAFGMGIDKSNIRSVVHYNVPKSLENYAQEIGRAGRDDEASSCHLLYCPPDLNTLSNFIYGDSPEPSSIRTLVEEILAPDAQPEIQVALGALGGRHDIRTLVTRTLLTYLEMDGHTEELTPVYGRYQFAAKMEEEEILGAFEGERRDFLRGLFASAKKARKWSTLELDETAKKLHCDRGRILRAFDYLADRNMLEVRASGLMHRFRRTGKPGNLEAIVSDLCSRMEERETRELGRLQQVVELATGDDCLAGRLSTHFGEPLSEACGVCSGCNSEPQSPALPLTKPLAEPLAKPPPQVELPEETLREALALRSDHPDALGTTRRLTKFLCGIGSPWTTAAKLHRHALFGALADVPFKNVQERLDGASDPTPESVR